VSPCEAVVAGGPAPGSKRACLRAVLIGRCADKDNVWSAEIEDAAGHPLKRLAENVLWESDVPERPEAIATKV